MKKLAVIALCMSAATAFAQEAMKFEVAAVKNGEVVQTATVMTVPRSEGMFGAVTETATVNEVNSHFGMIENKGTKIRSGFSGKVAYVPSKDSKFVEAAIDYELLDKGVTVSKGHHMVKAKAGETVTLPGANGVEIKLTLQS